MDLLGEESIMSMLSETFRKNERSSQNSKFRGIHLYMKLSLAKVPIGCLKDLEIWRKFSRQL